MPKKKTSSVLSIRLDQEAMKAVDLLVESGLESNRSRAVTHLVQVGIQASHDLLLRAREQADNLQRLRREMLEAVKLRDIGKVSELIGRDAALAEAGDQKGETPLLLATLMRANDIKPLLLENGMGKLNVFEAAAIGYIPRLEELLDYAPELVHEYNYDGFPLLSLAAHFGHGEAVELLLDRGADLHARSRDGSLDNMAIHAVIFGGYGELLDLLVARGADIDARCEGKLRNGYTVLHVAAYFDQVSIIDRLLAYGADQTLCNAEGQTPHALALSLGHIASAERLRLDEA
ncbi:hypothetical protein PA598K_02582 [Paenibacillus sp. 598K]|uniref:ankyrin repeat domain-containing protein n=1 Tax=Paenibacillus sp. 598K TaxID=1117987 RepID=UPI000FFAA615|nr:ankyrin repeat domain-containing protein [Paenibacillus sp. 598K]GBF74247.1 hypothetical protein PA598K_02582 [Paenibacillus sp. 598K]